MTKVVHLFIGALICMCALPVSLAADKDKLSTEESYVLGQLLADYMRKNNFHLLPEFESAAFMAGVRDIMAVNRPQYGYVSARPIRDQIFKRVRDAQIQERQLYQRYSQNPKAFMDYNRSRKQVVSLDNGLQYEVLKYGEGATPTEDNGVLLRFTAKVLGGEEFLNSVRDRQYSMKPIDMQKLTLPGWKQALLKMQVGDKWRIYIPPELGFGANGHQKFKVPANAVLVSDVELLEVLSHKDRQAGE